MSKKLFLTAARLQMFNDGGGATATAPTGEASNATNTENNTTQPIKYEPKSKRGRNSGKNGDLSNVVYGKQATAEPEPTTDIGTDSLAKGQSDVTTTSNTLEDRRRAFEEMTRDGGEYHDIFSEKFQQVFDRRFKEHKQTKAQLDEVKPVIDLLSSRYNIEDGNIQKIIEALETDDRYWEEAAEEAGLTVEQLKRMQKLEREHKEMQLMRKREESQRAADAQAAEWQRQADTTKQAYPQFDLMKEMENEQFRKLLYSGIPVQHAYETLHINELVTGAAAVAAKQAEERTVSRVKAKASRPAENGTSSQGSVIVKSDVSKFTPRDRAEIARRAARGEVIEF